MARLNLTAILLAGGFGTRIRQLFPGVPKPLIPIAGVPIIEWIVRLWALQGVSDFILSTGYLGDQIEQHFANRLTRLHVRCVRESTPLGTGGAVAFAAQALNAGEALLIGNADSVSSVDIASCIKKFEDTQADVLIGAAFREDTSQFGSIQLDASGRVVSFREKVPGPGLVNAGVYLMRRRLLASIPPGTAVSMERDIFPELLRKGALFAVHPIQGEFLDMGTPDGYAAAEQFLRSLPDFEAAEAYA